LLGGFERSREELKLVQNLIIASENNSRFAGEYGAYLFKNLGMFDSVKFALANQITKQEL